MGTSGMFDSVLNMPLSQRLFSNLYSYLPYAIYCIRHIQNSGIKVNAGIFKYIQHY